MFFGKLIPKQLTDDMMVFARGSAEFFILSQILLAATLSNKFYGYKASCTFDLKAWLTAVTRFNSASLCCYRGGQHQHIKLH
jgi:hypothetical protein